MTVYDCKLAVSLPIQIKKDLLANKCNFNIFCRHYSTTLTFAFPKYSKNILYIISNQLKNHTCTLYNPVLTASVPAQIHLYFSHTV